MVILCMFLTRCQQSGFTILIFVKNIFSTQDHAAAAYVDHFQGLHSSSQFKTVSLLLAFPSLHGKERQKRNTCGVSIRPSLRSQKNSL